MPLLQRSPRIVTFCPIGGPARPRSRGRRRVSLLRQAVMELRRRDHWAPVDALLFPGGFFRSSTFVGDRPHAERIQLLERERFLQGAMDICRAELDKFTPGAALVFGVDTNHPSSELHGDQLTVACRSRGIVAIGRKIFPTTKDTQPGRPCFVPADIDYSGSSRFLTLPNGSQALLCACYDAFGMPEQPTAMSIRSRAVRRLFSDGVLVDGGNAEFADLRRACLAAWVRRLRHEKPDIVLTAIHGFKRPGREGYWQRHGIALASAALGGALSVGAAHFKHVLPMRDEQAPLAATAVPRRHLLDGSHRRMWRHYPAESLAVFDPGDNRAAGVLRLYTPDE